MPFLSVNGIELPVADGGAQFESVELGSRERAFDGTLRKSRIGLKQRLVLETPLMLATDAEAWLNFIRGVGWNWSFEDPLLLYSHQGRGPTASTGSGASASTVQAKFGTRSCLVGSSSTCSFGLPLGSVWTVMGWRYTGGVWGHWVHRSDGAKWSAGVRNDALSSTALGSITTTGIVMSANIYMDDYVVLPYLVPNAWPPIFAAATTPFSPLPHLSVTGDALMGQTVVMRGFVRGVKYGNAVLGGSWQTNLQSLSIELEEV